MQLFLCNTYDSGNAILNEDESKHCIKVLRKKEGDILNLIDGVGGFYTAQIIDAHPKACVLKVMGAQKEFKRRNYYFHLAIAPTKNMDRIEWLTEKAVEIGIDEISFILCQTSERKIIKTERVLKIVESAVKQSVQAYLPKINELVPFKNFIFSQNESNSVKLIAHCQDNNDKTVKELVTKEQEIICLVGPEGDFSKSEIDIALQNNFLPVNFGQNRLRTETAGLFICNAVALINQ